MAASAGFCSTASLASNGSKARVPVTWPVGHACATVVDRATTPVLHIAYGFDGPDDLRPADAADEVADSRTHQFFAFCRDHDRLAALPSWITRQDVNRAQALGVLPQAVEGRDVLEENPSWQGCFWRINDDHARRLIRHDVAAQGVDWQLANLPSAAFVIGAYTFEPATNRWSDALRPGVVTVYDSRLGETPPPAIALTSGSQIAYRNRPMMISACLQADAGATLHVEWSLAQSGQAPQWTEFMHGPAPANGEFAFAFMPPAHVLTGPTTPLMLRTRLRDPSGRTFEAYSRHDLVVLANDAPDETNGDSSGGTTDTPAGDPTAKDDGCRIAGGRPADAASFVALSLIAALGAWARQRYARAHLITPHGNLRGSDFRCLCRKALRYHQ